MSSEEGRSRNW